MAKTVVWCERGCQNHTFTETGISSILGFIWRSFWKQKLYKSGNVAHFGAPVWESGAHCWLAGWLLAGWLAMGPQDLRQYGQVMVTGLSPGVW